eukprot:7939484-Prorocentrum_lima.AAC.1
MEIKTPCTESSTDQGHTSLSAQTGQVHTWNKSIIADGLTQVLQTEKLKEAQERLLLQDVTK